MTESDDVKVTFFQKKSEMGTIREPRVLRKAVDFTRNGGRVVITPDSSSKAIEGPSRAIPRMARPPPPINEKKIIRKARKSGPVVPVHIEADQPQGYSETETIEQEIQRSMVKVKVEHTTDKGEDTTAVAEDPVINTSDLRRFAMEKLHKKSILREIVLLEEKELTVEQFLSKLPIWLRLLNHGE